MAGEERFDAVVVGAGFGGLYALHRLREQGLSVVGVEAAPDVGGTWYWNRYPGCRCDWPSLYYSYSWSPELRSEWRWTELYAGQPEILAYARFAAERLGLRNLVRFETRVTSAAFDDDETWLVRTDRGEALRARFCVMATGCLSVPSEPDFPDLESFAGPIYHTGRWPHEPVDFAGLRVGVIGTGSSGVQTIPMVAREADRLTVFQRTPCYSVPARNRPLTEEDLEAFEADFPLYLAGLDSERSGRVSADAFEAPVPPREEQLEHYEAFWQRGGGAILLAYPNMLTSREVNQVACEFLREKIRQVVEDPATAEVLCPRYPLGAKRICLDTGYYETFNRPNVTLVDLRKEPIECLARDALRTTANDYEIDALVLATGFDAMTGALLGIDIRGRSGVSLADAWRDGPRAYLGIAVAGFPNMFVLTGPGSPSVIGNVLHNDEHHVDWMMGCIEYLDRRGLSTVEADEEAQDAWAEHVSEVGHRTLIPTTDSWYVGTNVDGKPRVFMPYVGQGYRHRCARIADNGYEGFRLG